MTTVDTMDTAGSVAQSIRMVSAGCEYVRITAPSIKEAHNLQHIKEGLVQKGIAVPLIADIHFTPNAAEVAAKIVEKVRVNPGNYVDKKKFQTIEYSEEEYQAEINRIREKFTPLVRICKANGTAMRIGTNHGSLSDRILSRFGDTPLGMVESALEFLRICEAEDYHDVVLSMKASNTRVMIQAYRLLVHKLQEEGMRPYPLHLGVTEAGEGEDGRIKSAVGIGTLLEDGLGDTVRVSLTEEPEFEIPVARALVERYAGRAGLSAIPPLETSPKNPFIYERRTTLPVDNIGGNQVPRVMADMSAEALTEVSRLQAIGHHYLAATDKWTMTDLGADYVYLGQFLPGFMLPNGLRGVIDYEQWAKLTDKNNLLPMFDVGNYTPVGDTSGFLRLNVDTDPIPDSLNDRTVLVIETNEEHAMAGLRRFIFGLMAAGITNPVVIERAFDGIETSLMQLYAATDMGGLLIDGLGDGVMLSFPDLTQANTTAFGVLQAARTRMTKTEYISCPSCGRTLFDLQKTTAMIRKETDHLKGVKIGIMGCIVNGPGEMADADYGYVGSGKGKITLYKGQEVVQRNVPSDEAVGALIELIKTHGDWVEPELVNL
jgi:(E)-4-hydroxy-3-methylbut-2-enyl-diphosphate synthase